MQHAFRIFAAFFVINIRIALSQETFENQCAAFGVTSQPNFIRLLYMGKWYIQGLYNYPDVENADCTTSIYVPSRDGNANIIERSKNLQTNTPKRIESLMIFDSPGSGQYVYEVPGVSSSLPIQIISTDYFHYSIEWNCTYGSGQSQCYIWLMTRRRVFSPKLEIQINQILNDHHIDTTRIRRINQDLLLCL